MSRQALKDARYHVIGYIDTDAQGKQTLLNERFHKLGYFDPKANETKDEFFRRVGSGNLLTTLLCPRR